MSRTENTPHVSLPALTYMVKARASVDGASMVHAARTKLSPKRVQTLLARIEGVRRRREQPAAADLLKEVYFDWSATEFFMEPDDYWDLEEEDHPDHAYFQVFEEARDGWGFLVAEGASGLPEMEHARTELEQMEVYESEVSWTAHFKHTDTQLWTNRLAVGDLLLADLYYTAPERRHEAFHRLASRAPDLALNVLERGIAVFGMEPIRVTDQLTPESVVPLLESENSAYRQKAIVLLGETGRAILTGAEGRTQKR